MEAYSDPKLFTDPNLTRLRSIEHVSIIDWESGSREFFEEPFKKLGYQTQVFDPTNDFPKETDLIFSFGYFDNFFSFLSRFEHLKPYQRPLFIHWNTEGVPDLRFPGWMIKWGSPLRSYIGRQAHHENPRPFFRFLNRKAHRFRYLGDYLYAHRKGLMAMLFDCSRLYVDMEKSLGMTAHYIPWGTLQSDYSMLNLNRDIDVLWMGKPRGSRRNDLVKLLREELAKYGKKMVVIDGVEHPYVYGRERTELFNRSRITLNLLPAWDAYNYLFKFHLAAGNRSLLVSERFLDHAPEYIDGYHYVASSVENLVPTLIHYCEKKEERTRITENAYELVTTNLTMTNSIRKIMSLVDSEEFSDEFTPS